MLVYGECECFVMQMLDVCVLCASCGSSQCCVLHDLQFATQLTKAVGGKSCLVTIMINNFTKLLTVWHKCPSKAYKGTRRKHNMKFRQIGHTTSQYHEYGVWTVVFS